MSEDKHTLYDACRPSVLAGQEVRIALSQRLEKETPAWPFGQHVTNLLTQAGPNVVRFATHGPQTSLMPSDVAGIYPAAGSDDSPEEFLPHIALSRRTLPWERVGPGGAGHVWLALLLLRQSELRPAEGELGAHVGPQRVGDVAPNDPVAHACMRSAGLADDATVDLVWIPHRRLRNILPDGVAEVDLLAHVKRTESGDAAHTLTDTAIVVCNRLPDARDPNEVNTALLVSLERRDDLFNLSRQLPRRIGGSAAMLVLHRWQFKASAGGDFEEVMQRIRVRPNGGVLRFGNLPQPAAAGDAVASISGGLAGRLDADGYLRHGMPQAQGGRAEYRGPLRPFEPMLRSRGFAVRAAPEEFEAAAPGGLPDQSSAAAFELGRLLALADASLLDELRNIRRSYPEIKIVEANTMPPVLQKPEWVTNPQPFWSFGPGDGLLRTELDLEQTAGRGDLTGITTLAPTWQAFVDHQFAGLPPAEAPNAGLIDIGRFSERDLEARFAGLAGLGV